MPNSIGRVVAGLIFHHEKEGCVLMGRRRSEARRGGLWEMPGGKVEHGEDPRAALSREWREELGINPADIEVGDMVATAFLDLEVAFVVDLYIVEHREGILRPQALDHDELRWVNPLLAVREMPCSPAFYAHYPWIRRLCGGR